MDNKNHTINEEIIIKQKQICLKYNAIYTPASYDYLIGVALSTFEGKLLFPINGLRHPRQSEHVTNWYIWAGEEYSEANNFFEPIHIAHLIDKCPKALYYLGLPPGWRFLFDNVYEDVWFDKSLLNI